MSDYTKIILRQGLEIDRDNVVFSRGEPFYVTDFGRLFVGDGVKLGGNLVSNKFLGFLNFDLNTFATGVVSAYVGDVLYDLTTNNLYALTGASPSNLTSYARITRNFTADDITTTLNQTSAISVKIKSLNANYMDDVFFGRGLVRDGLELSMQIPPSEGGLTFNDNGQLVIRNRGVVNDMLAPMQGNHIKGNLGLYGDVEDIPLVNLATSLAPLLQSVNQNFGVPIGTIIDFAGTTPPEGYLFCYGQTFSASEYPELYNVIKNTWGGVYPLFSLPDLSRKVTAGSGGIPSSSLSEYVGAVGGDETAFLLTENIPSHIHSFQAVVGGGGRNLVTTLSGNDYVFDTAFTGDGSTNSIPGGLNPGNAGQPFSIIQPTAIVAKCIKAY